MEEEDNIRVHEKEGKVTISVNPKIYYIDVVYSAAYVFLDKAYILLDGDPEKEVIVELRYKNKNHNKIALTKLGQEFYNELLNYSFHKTQSERNKNIRETIIKRALFENNLEIIGSPDEIEDPEGIAMTWEEKYGKTK